MTGKTVPERIKKCRRIIVKIGSVLVTDQETGQVKPGWLSALARDIAALKEEGNEIVIVSSGAIALGRKTIGVPYDAPPAAIALDQKQASAAAGQIELIIAYHKAFSEAGLNIAQALLSPHDTENRRSHLNARATLNALLARGVVPIINENDSVATDEIKFGDNDRLAARVGQMIEADLVILLSTTDGLYTSDPAKNPDAVLIPLVKNIDDEYFDMAGEAPSGFSTGGMRSKLEAARLATHAGSALLISDGIEEHALIDLSRNSERKSTWFYPVGNPAKARKRWIESHLKTAGVITIDDGALTALQKGKSLLPIGVTSVKGSFDRGDAVSVRSNDGKEVAVGLAAFNSFEAQKIAGLKSHEVEKILGYSGRSEMIHRNDLAILLKNRISLSN